LPATRSGGAAQLPRARRQSHRNQLPRNPQQPPREIET
jgi:hypothetical protein